MVKKNACVFISGYGSNLKSLIDNSRNHNFPVNISLVITNNFKAKGLLHAKKNSIPYFIINTKKRNFENKVLNLTKKYNISLICLAGYMKIISKRFINTYRKKIINIHPSLLPKYKGLNTHEKAIKNKDKYSGCTVHFVNSKLDSGKIINQKKVIINKFDTPKTLARKILIQEHKLYPAAIIKILRP